MSTEPLVVCVMLACDRPEMQQRAVKSFRAQTYENKRLLIWDTSQQRILGWYRDEWRGVGEAHVYADQGRDFNRFTIGELRNQANGFWTEYDIVAHWDSDDWSHPERLTEQVRLLGSQGVDVVGYKDMLFYKGCASCNYGRANTLPRCPVCALPYDPMRPTPIGEAWLYEHPMRSYCVGSSLMYWRTVWEHHKFQALPTRKTSTGEDTEFLRGLRTVGISSVKQADRAFLVGPNTAIIPSTPRMVCTIHGNNTADYAGAIAGSPQGWKRIPEWDAELGRIMEL